MDSEEQGGECRTEHCYAACDQPESACEQPLRPVGAAALLVSYLTICDLRFSADGMQYGGEIRVQAAQGDDVRFMRVGEFS